MTTPRALAVEPTDSLREPFQTLSDTELREHLDRLIDKDRLDEQDALFLVDCFEKNPDLEEALDAVLLLRAAKRGWERVVNRLLDNATPYCVLQAQKNAAAAGHVETLAILLDKVAPKSASTLMRSAIQDGHVSCFDLLAKRFEPRREEYLVIEECEPDVRDDLRRIFFENVSSFELVSFEWGREFAGPGANVSHWEGVINVLLHPAVWSRIPPTLFNDLPPSYADQLRTRLCEEEVKVLREELGEEAGKAVGARKRI